MECALLISLTLLSSLDQATAQEELVNGNFESFSGGLPTGWGYESDNVGPAVLQSSAFTSPFTSVYPAGNYSILLSNKPTVSPLPQLYQYYTAFNGNFSLSFDFRLGAAPQGNAWAVLPLSTGGVVPFNLFVDRGGEFAATDAYSINNIASLNPNTWYHVAVAGSISGGEYSGTIMPFGGTAVSWSDYSFLSSINVLSGISIDNDVEADVANTPTYFDNFSVNAVPEPSAAAVAVVATGALLAFKRRPVAHIKIERVTVA
jgi:hypothetical protein